MEIERIAKGVTDPTSAAQRKKYGSARYYKLRARYGITPAAFERAAIAQNHECSICHRRSELHVDHDHATGEVRGLLCEMCNGFLGAFRDDPDLLEAAARYLEAHGR